MWAGISLQGPTKICIFDGVMDAELYVNILQSTLLPFLEKLPRGHRFMQDNDPKHTSRLARSFFEGNNVNWWKTAPESPDLSPIENLWHELKEYIRREAKPRTKEELIQGIKDFWKTVNKDKCTRYSIFDYQFFIFHHRHTVFRDIDLIGPGACQFSIMKLLLNLRV